VSYKTSIAYYADQVTKVSQALGVANEMVEQLQAEVNKLLASNKELLAENNWLRGAVGGQPRRIPGCKFIDCAECNDGEGGSCK